MKSLIENAMRLQAARAMSRLHTSRIGQITSYDPNRHAVKVTYQPDGDKSGWMPLASAWVGNGWGLFAAPEVGQTAIVSFVEGALDGPVAELRLYNDANQPLAVPAGEFWVVHASGSFLKFINDGKVSANSDTDMEITVGGDLHATVQGDVTADVTGDATLTANTATVNAPTTINDDLTVNGTITASGDVTAGSVSLQNHVHTGVQSGSSSTGKPTG